MIHEPAIISRSRSGSSARTATHFAIMGRVNAALKKVGISGKETEEFRNQAMSGNYDQLPRTVMEWVEVE